jgi:exodeoxyribonuclease V beta subunit
MTERDLGLEVPLHGVQLIEASAGTGKTFTVATLYARLVIEAGLPVSSILAVTYTVAATAELRERLRERLQLARRLAEGEAIDGAEAAALAPLVGQARAAEGDAALLRRLRVAVEDMDLAPIHTIHAFCQRALAEHAVDAGLPPLRRELIANERGLREEVATEFWRRHSLDADGARLLATWSGPAQLAEMLRDLLAADALAPAAEADEDAGAEDRLRGCCDELARLFREHGTGARALLERAMAAGALNRQRFNDKSLDAVWQSLAAWSEGARDPATLHDNTPWFGTTQIDAKRNRNAAPIPPSPLFDAIEALVQARACCAAREQRQRVALLHALRDFARGRLAQLKRERNLQGFDDLVTAMAGALQGETGDAFAARLQVQYRAALVDEFQDTDARQDAIFRRLFASRALFLVGDPKQAIYRFRGGDVLAYLQARERADASHALQRNFRSRPRALAAVGALFERAGADAFAWPGIGFQRVEPGGVVADADFTRDGAVAPALTFQRLRGIDGKTGIGRVREQAADACAAEVLALLQGEAERRDRDGRRRVRPGDIAILIERNADAPPLRAALSALGIPSVAPGRESLYASAEAGELRRLLRALRTPGDEARLRGALATVLLGFDAAALDALARDEEAQRGWQDRFQAWRQRAERHGPLGVVAEICAAGAARLLRWPDGERRLGNYLQLAEALQEGGRALDVDTALAELDRRIDAADADNDEELPRLESDADRVTVLTLHKSKGLEFDFVFLPFVATHGGNGRARVPRRVRVHEAGRQVLHLLGSDEQSDALAEAREAAEERAERVRLLYVGLTRARFATWLAWGPAKGVQDTALAWLLHRAAGAAKVEAPDDAWLDADLARLQAAAPEAIAIVDAPALPDAWYRPEAPQALPPARTARRELSRDWWIYSYSMLANEPRNDLAHVEERGADDEVEAPQLPLPERSRFAGARFGNSLHAALEHADAARWRGWREAGPPPGQRALLEKALGDEGFTPDGDFEDGVLLLSQLVRNTLETPLPEGVCLSELPRAARRDELEFHLGLAPTRLDDLLAVLHAHGVVRERGGFGVRRRIEGLLTGRIDLVYAVDERVYLLDYKSNRLPDYAPVALEQAMRDSEYDLQYVLYTLALHRWLRFRRGPGYDYERDFGGVRYLFCRGLDPDDGGVRGVHAVKPPFALIDALDRLFAATEAMA